MGVAHVAAGLHPAAAPGPQQRAPGVCPESGQRPFIPAHLLAWQYKLNRLVDLYASTECTMVVKPCCAALYNPSAVGETFQGDKPACRNNKGTLIAGHQWAQQYQHVAQSTAQACSKHRHSGLCW